jgi:hypothetical protein
MGEQHEAASVLPRDDLAAPPLRDGDDVVIVNTGAATLPP